MFSEDTKIEFGISKFATRIMKRGIILRNEGIQLLNDEVIKYIEDGEVYEYLGILKVDKFKNLVMKEKVRK